MVCVCGSCPPLSAPIQQRLQPQSHQCSLETNHPSWQTNSPSLLPSILLLSSVPINRLFAHQFILQYGPQISEQQFLKCVTPDYRLRVVESFAFFSIIKKLYVYSRSPTFLDIVCCQIHESNTLKVFRTARGEFTMRGIVPRGGFSSSIKGILAFNY